MEKYISIPLFEKTLALTTELIAQQSISPDQSTALTIIANRLEYLGFKNEWLNFGEVKNLYSVFDNGSPFFMFAGHTDVVPPGNEDLWKHPPFKATVENEILYGRGAADMKSSIAAFLVACEDFINHHSFQGSIAFLITADEEAKAINGTKKAVAELIKRKQKIDYCLIGEPSSSKKIGDIVKNGRRGSLNGKLIIKGKQGHIAYPHLADNPIHKIPEILQPLLDTKWDQGNDYFQPTQLQFSNIHAGTGVSNVIANECTIDFNFRYSSETNADSLKLKVEEVLKKSHSCYEIKWDESGRVFFSKPKLLFEALKKAIIEVQGFEPQISTGGGTSDGRFICELNPEIIEFGPNNQTIHQINESISLADLSQLSLIHQQLLKNIFLNHQYSLQKNQ